MVKIEGRSSQQHTMDDSKNAELAKLNWIEDDSRPSEEFPLVGQRATTKSILEKLGDNILVPMGLLATTACLTLGLISMNRGDSKRQQLFMRGRVFFQCFTFASMFIGIALTTKSRSNRDSSR